MIKIEEAENTYVTKDGNFYTLYGNEIHKRILQKHSAGYLSIAFTINKKSTYYLAHRLVAKYYVKNRMPDKYKIVNHIDGNKQNNNYQNLEWTNYKLNSQHASRIGLIGNGISTGPPRKYDSKLRKVIKSQYNGKHGCYTALSKKYKINLTTIIKIVNE